MQKYNSPKKNSSWETVELKKSDIVESLRTLSFHLQWTKEESGKVVDRPITVNCNNNNIGNNDKENHKPANSAINGNHNNSSSNGKSSQESGEFDLEFSFKRYMRCLKYP